MRPSHAPSGSRDDFYVPGSWPTHGEVDHRQHGNYVVAEDQYRSQHGYNNAQNFGANSVQNYDMNQVRYRGTPMHVTPFDPYMVAQQQHSPAYHQQLARPPYPGGHGTNFFHSGHNQAAVQYPLAHPNEVLYGGAPPHAPFYSPLQNSNLQFQPMFASSMHHHGTSAAAPRLVQTRLPRPHPNAVPIAHAPLLHALPVVPAQPFPLDNAEIPADLQTVPSVPFGQADDELPPIPALDESVAGDDIGPRDPYVPYSGEHKPSDDFEAQTMIRAFIAHTKEAAREAAATRTMFADFLAMGGCVGGVGGVLFT